MESAAVLLMVLLMESAAVLLISERVIAALWPNRRDTQNTVAMLEFAPLAPPGAEVEVVYILDTPTLMRALQAFRDTYELRKSAAIDKIIAEVEGLMRSACRRRSAPSAAAAARS